MLYYFKYWGKLSSFRILLFSNFQNCSMKFQYDFLLICQNNILIFRKQFKNEYLKSQKSKVRVNGTSPKLCWICQPLFPVFAHNHLGRNSQQLAIFITSIFLFFKLATSVIFYFLYFFFWWGGWLLNTYSLQFANNSVDR